MAKTTQSTTQKTTKTKEEPSLIGDNTKLSLTIPWSKIEEEYEKVLGRAARKIKVKGFRKGSVPKKIAEEQIGREKLVDEVLQGVVPPLYQELIEKEDKKPLTSPEFNAVSLEWGKDWILDVFIAEKPEIKLGNYKKTIVEGAKEAAKELKQMEKELKDHEHHDHSDGHTHPDPKSQEREVKLHHIFKALVQTIRPTIPELLLKEETKQELHRLSHELERIGLTLENYLERKKQSFEELSQELAAQTLGQLQLALVLDALEKEEKIGVTDEDMAQEFAKMKDEQMKTQIQQNARYTEYLQTQIRRRKLLDWMTTL